MPEHPQRIVCDRCAKADAVVHVTSFQDQRVTLHHYCADCARAISASVGAPPKEQPPG